MDFETAIRCLSALAQDTRLSIFRLLIPLGDNGLSAGAIGEHLGKPAPTLSFHLKELERAGLVRSQRNGRQINYAIEPEAMRALILFLLDDCCQGHPEICTPRISHHLRELVEGVR